MTTGLVLILAILVLGGVIATVGDRLGTRVGKARLTWFNLRPRKTATLITILTGAIISASTLGILFALSENLRQGVFDFERINRERREAEDKLAAAQAEIGNIQNRLQQARERQRQVRQQLSRINQDLKGAIARQQVTQGKLNNAEAQLGQIQSRFQSAQQSLASVSQQLASVQSDIQRLQSDRQLLIRQRDQVREQIAQRDQQIAQRDRQIKEREAQLATLEDQRIDLAQEVDSLGEQVSSLGEQLQDLRLGRVSLLRNQPLASGVLRVVEPAAAPEAVNNLLWQANRFALQRLRPDVRDFNRQILRVTTDQVEQLSKQIQDGKEYVVRVLSSGNYVLGEPCVLAGNQCIDVALIALENQLVFPKDSIVATIAIDPQKMTNDEIAEQLRRIIAAAQFRARQAGLLGERIEIANNNLEAIAQFYERVTQYNQPLDIQVISLSNAYPAGDAELELIAVQNGQVLFSTR